MKANLIFQISNQGRKNTEPQVKTYPVFNAGLKVDFYSVAKYNVAYREIKEQIGVRSA